MLKLIYLRLHLLAISVIITITTGYSQLYINEILTANVTINPDPDYVNYGDWIEIYNAGSSSVNLYNYTVTDDITQPGKYRINYTNYISAHSYKLIWADQENYHSHTNFALDNDGEFIALINPGGTIVDSITYKKQIPDISYGRQPDGSNTWVYFAEPTPESSNSSSGIADLIQAPDVSFSLSPGFYTSNQTVTISSASPTGAIHYTIDGSIPTDNSPLYSSPVQISSTTVLKARCFESGVLPGDIGVSTYFINESFDIPVVSLSTDPYYFFDDSWGIYVEGENGIPGCGHEEPANWFQDWERPINFEYFESNGECKVNKMVGVKLIGSCTRNFNLKSLTLISREKYGKSGLDYRFFSDKDINSFKSLNLRSSGNDLEETMLRDGFMQNLLIGRMDIDYESYQPTVVFLNGEYWGILNLREKMNEHYVESNYGINSDDVSVLENNASVVHGSADHYEDLVDYINSYNLGVEANFEYVNSQMDINEYLNYYISETFFDNEDWPHNNIRYWRENNSTGRWRWMVFDTDYGFGLFNYYSGNNLKDLSSTYWSRDVIRGLMENQNFENEFIQRFAAHLNTTFEPNRVVGILDSIASIIDSKMPRHINKWHHPPNYDPSWLGFVDNMRDYAYSRVPSMRNQIINYFDIPGTYNLETSVSIPNSGIIKLCEVDITNAPEGLYFDNIPIRMEAVPEEGYVFTGWTGDINNTSNPISLTFSSDVFIQANFEEDEIPDISNIYINEFAAHDTWVTDDHGDHEDWIEIYNDNDFPVDIGGLYVSDLISFPLKCQISKDFPEITTIPPNGYLVLWADREPNEGVLHLNFKLDNDGEQLSLVERRAGTNVYLDSLHFNKQYVNTTYGRYPDGDDEWCYLIPTAGSSNISYDTPFSGIVINEFSADNDNIIADENGEYDDWIEIYNPTDDPVNIGGLFITDSLNYRTKHRIPSAYPDSTTIPAHGYLVLWADEQEEQGVLHLGFKLGRNGEQIGLVGYNGTDYIDSLTYGKQYSNSSASRYPDGTDIWIHPPPTPGSANTLPVISGLYINEFSASNANIIADGNGEYDDWIEIYNSTDNPVNIGGLYITDSLDCPDKDRIPSTYPDSTTIPAHGYLILWADNTEDQGVLHLDFNLSRSGEQIGLAGYDRTGFINSLTYGEQLTNSSSSRIPDGNDFWIYAMPTPGSTNILPVISGLYINEFSASNTDIITDEHGDYDDWIEIYNSTDAPLDIGGLYITDNLNDLTKYRIPVTDPGQTTIPAYGYLILWADDQEEQGVLHLGFNLSRTGEEIGLVKYNGTDIIDSVTYGEQPSNSSSSRYPDGNDIWIFAPPTPGRTNTVPVILSYSIEGTGNIKFTLDYMPGYSTFNVYRDTVACFTPDRAGGTNRIAGNITDENPGEEGLQWTDINVVGNTDINYFYIFTAVGANESANSVTIGEFDYNLITTPTTDFNEIALPLNIEGITNAAELMAAIPGCNSVARWDASEQGYYQYISFLPLTNFPVEMGYPYYVNVTGNVVYSLIGVIVQPTFSLITTPTTDFNEVMLTLDKTDITQASGLVADIPSCNSIARWDAEEQGYYQYVSFLPMTNFNVRVGYPYYVNVSSNVTWPEAGKGSGSMKSTSGNSCEQVLLEKSSAPHLAYGTIKIKDLNINESDINLSAYISSLPEEKLNENSAGCTVQDGYWIVQCNTFPSGWRAGEKVIMELKDKKGDLLGEAEVELTYNPADKATDLIIEGGNNCYLSQNIPNPFGYETLIQYRIPEYGPVQIEVYSITGQKVRTLVHEYKDEGKYEVIWDASDDSGRKLQEGMYIYILKNNDNIIIRKALLLK
jgi:hypothetical protein